MHFSIVLMCTALLTSVVYAFSPEYLDFGNVQPDHILWGGSAHPSESFQKRQATATTKATDSSCTNSPTTRYCWSNGYSVGTDFDAKWPSTGRTRSYTLTVTNSTCNPDGTGDRVCLLYNDQLPGPTITADWGDMIQVTVVNNLQDNGTSTHWHGIRQLKTNIQDGVNGLTECPLAPGNSKTYLFQATQFGTSWYHSHYSVQYGDGLSGPIVINGPAAANYDIDMGPIPVQDWYYQTTFQVADVTNGNLQSGQGPPPSDSILLGGMNKNAAGAGAYMEKTMIKGKKYRFRLINTSIDNSIRVSIDNHAMQVITSDFVPIKPVFTDSVLLGVGQRYDVIVTANQDIGNYWMRAAASTACASGGTHVGLAIINYQGAAVGDPTTTSTAVDNGCNPPGPLTPWVSNTVGDAASFKAQARNLNVNLELPGTTTNNQNIVVWGVNMTAIDVQWDTPTLSYVMTGNTTYPQTANLIEIPNEGTWTYWVIQEVAGGVAQIPHPIHLHGHDFYIMGNGTGIFDINTGPDTLTYNNPPRRDTTMLPGGGWLVIAFPADNPGSWLMHCHIAWHISEGLGIQFLEAKSQINLPGPSYTDQCNNWKSYYATTHYRQDDSGL